MTKLLQTILLITLLVQGSLLAGADLLDKLGEQLDQLEPRFWTALGRSPDSDYYKQTKELVRDAMTTSRAIQRELERQNIRFSPSIAGEMMKIQRIFDEDVKRTTASNYSVRINSTGMTAYTRTFQQLQTEQQTGPGRRVEKKVPTLDNVDVNAYQNWLVNLNKQNSQQTRRSSSDRDSRQSENMKIKVEEFCESIVKIRVALVRLRQEVKLQFY